MFDNLRSTSLLSHLEFGLVGLLVAAAFLKTALLPWPVIAFALFFVLNGVLTRRWWTRTPLDLPAAGLLLMLPVTLWATALPEITVPQVWRVLNGVVFYYAIVRWCVDESRLRLLVYGVLLAGVGIAAFAPFSVTWSTSKLGFIPAGVYQRFSVLVSDTVHPNVMGGNLALFLPLAAAVLLFDWEGTSWRERTLTVLAGVFMGGVLILTKSRGAWMGVALAFGILLLLRWRWWGAGAVALAGGGAFLWVQNNLGWGTFWQTVSTSGVVSGFEGREEIWSRAIYMLQDFPFTGIGMGSFGKVADLLYPFFLAAPGKVPHAHNLFLQIGVDLGLPGLIAWLACWFGVMAMGWRLHRSAPSALGRSVGTGVLLAQVALGVHGIFDAVVWGLVRSAPLLWMLWALAASALNLYLSPAKETSREPASR